ncbi:MAG: hypothetical protein IPG09_18195 [Ignavibacteria bacterium]|nr:hypothetical protein [Ignavibacteria bacterium]
MKNFHRMFDAGANQFVVGTSGLFSLDNDIEIAWSNMKKHEGMKIFIGAIELVLS